jgi:hypothetical protein
MRSGEAPPTSALSHPVQAIARLAPIAGLESVRASGAHPLSGLEQAARANRGRNSSAGRQAVQRVRMQLRWWRQIHTIYQRCSARGMLQECTYNTGRKRDANLEAPSAIGGLLRANQGLWKHAIDAVRRIR